MTTIVETPAARKPALSLKGFAYYLMLGLFFGIVLVKSEVVSWFRIQEMFRFDSFHMYGVIGSAVAVGAISIALIKKWSVKGASGQPISIPDKEWGRGTRYWLGGTLFGVGWGLIGACPGPMFALIGTGASVMLAGLAAAVLGTWVYGAVRPHLPH